MATTQSTAVLLLSHGSRDPRAAYVVHELVAAVAERTGRVVRAAHLDFTGPTPDVALRRLANDGFSAVRVVPLLFTPGYHLTHDVPRAIAASGVADTVDVTVAPALLSDDPALRTLLLRALVDRLTQAQAQAQAQAGTEGTGLDGLVLASAGSSSPEARAVVASLARDLGDVLGIPVMPAFASAVTPSPVQALEALSDQGIGRPAVASLFVAPGKLPDSVVAACPDLPVADPLGVSPAFVELLVAQTWCGALPPVSQWIPSGYRR